MYKKCFYGIKIMKKGKGTKCFKVIIFKNLITMKNINL